MSENHTNNRICPNCGTYYNIGDAFCMNCGVKLSHENVCPNCGAKVLDNDSFCGICGANLKNTQPNIQNPNNVIPQVVLNNTADENTVKCPYCGSKVKRNIKKCPHCGEWLSGVSHFGCGTAMVLLSIIAGIGSFSFGNEIQLPFLGAVSGFLLFILVFFYFLPSLIADSRGHDSSFAIFLINLFFGWTAIGWLLCLIIAFTGRSR